MESSNPSDRIWNAAYALRIEATRTGQQRMANFVLRWLLRRIKEMPPGLSSELQDEMAQFLSEDIE